MEQCLSLPPFTPSSPKKHQSLQTPSPLHLHHHSLKNLTNPYFSQQIQAQIIKTGITANLIKMHSESGNTQSAALLFSMATESGTLHWSHLITAFSNTSESLRHLLEIFRELHRTGMLSNAGLLTAALKASNELLDLRFGSQVHAFLAKSGFDAETRIKCSLMDLYADCESLQSLEKLFGEVQMEEDTVLWNKVVTMSAESGLWLKSLELFGRMQSLNLKADEVTIAKVLNSCGRIEALKHGKEIHGFVIRSGLSSNLLVSNSLITMYSKNSSMELARRVFEPIANPSLVSWNSMISSYSLNGLLNDAMELFDSMVSSGMEPDLVTWNCLISGHSHHGSDYKVFELFRRMQVEGFKPNSSTITSTLRTIGESGLLKFGKEVHGYVMRNGLQFNVYSGTSLVDMFIKCCSLTHARRVFDTMKHRNLITWNTLISGYAYSGVFSKALQLVKQMEREGIHPDLATWNGLISGYSMKGQSSQALVLIRQLKAMGIEPNVVSWTSLISGCCQNGQYEDSLYFFTEMQKDGVEPNTATVATLLRACAGLASLKKGAELHCFAARKGLDSDIFVSTALIDMYSKSGSLRNAHQVFKKIGDKNLASWNAMIMGFAAYGQAEEASSLFDQMCRLGIQPDGITFTALLSSCRHSGLISEGWKYFDDMKNKHGITPRLEHYTSMVDLLARGGYLDEALDFIQEMPLEPDASLWGALLGACRTHRNLKIAETAAKHLFKLEPYNSANYLLMMSSYAYENRWGDVENMRDAMSVAEVKSRAGWSWIQIGATVHVFNVEGKQHPDIGEIYFELYQLISEIKRLGYVPDTSCIVHNVGEEEKERLLMGHTEKLAITYGLICTGSSSVIRVIKNTRVCNDCHLVAKYASSISGREIYLRDGVRFHHFRDGKCSCNDYW